MLTPEQKIKRHQKIIQDLVTRMSGRARKFFCGPVVAKADQAIVELHQGDYLRMPVRIEQFVEDPKYLGSVLRGNIYPKILDDLIELFDGNYSEVLLGGSIGWGKTIMATIGITYDMYCVSCLKSPTEMYGLLPGSNLAFINVSVNKTQATKVLFGGIGNLVRSSPYFRTKFPFAPNITSELRFPRGIFAYPVAANEQALLGEGVFSAAFDEMNFYSVVEKSKKQPEGGQYDQATQLYNRMSMRLKSRMNQRGMLPGHLWMISSARYPNDFTERKAAEAQTDTSIFVRQYTAWDTKPKQYFMTTTFKVEVGDITRRSRILDGTETDVNPDQVLEVPMDFKDAFEKDPDEASRAFGGASVLSIRPFIGRRDLITAMMRKSADMGLKHAFSEFTVTLQYEHEHLIPEDFQWVADHDKKGNVVGKHIATGPYFAHIDLAKNNDACGFCVTHIVGSTQVSRGFGRDKKFETRPIIRVDLALQIVAPPRGEIRISSVRELLFQLRDLGMQFGKVSYDSYASEDSIQILKGEGFSAENLSVDTDASPYEAAKEGIYDGRIQCPENPILAVELATIRKDDKTGKVDHLPNTKKDLADAFAGAVWHAEKGYVGGATSQWGPVTTVQPEVNFGFENDQAYLWDKIARNLPLTEDEINRIR
jgi:hypothetical protein